MSPTQPTDAELDVMIRARLAAIGIDLDQLPEGSTPDPETGSPGRDTALASLRGFVRSTILPLGAYQVATTGPADDLQALAQQVAAPALYPSIDITRQTR
ncbi:hypothetical protein EV643_14030 [Kribbella sp. VKM Ac-2527]|uniref:Uncharacterized protein n=1 Tax=Kribbella caucasensis TaxID=2512215 RepID=A0A4R6J4A8_9ACTN|nr:hypothetical protein [Kribbella sp. VKM Ac-2527]TDO30199.1 hypothetical protein EV643_14030 [Kribbella sp. VKM Ac-2527]